ncbi:MAG: transposase [Paludibacteraceae bacterium]|nr:transposase [Paludibacteraceae bacterium]
MKRGLEILGIALVDADTREAYAIRAVQTLIQRIRRGRRPKCVAHIERDSLVSHYLKALYDFRDQLLQLSNIIVADAFFSKATFAQGLSVLGFELVSRFRDDVRLKYLYTGEKTSKRGRPKQFDGVVDLTNLKEDVFSTESYDWDGVEVKIHSAVVYAVSLKRNVKVVIVDFDDSDKKTLTRKVFFSTDCSMSAKDVIDIYRSRFQIEFLFRDAKQFTGLCHCQSRNIEAMDFAFNLSLSAINVARAFGKQNDLNLSIADCKLLFHNAMMIESFLSTFGNAPNLHKNQGQKEHYFKDLLLFGLKAAA